MKGNKVIRLLASAATLALAASAMVGVTTATAATSKTCNLKSKPTNAVCDTFIYASLHRVQSLDKKAPISGYTESQMSYIVQGQLYRFDADGEARRDLVESESISADSLTITQTLKSGLKYSDGTPVVANDAVVSYDRWATSKFSAGYIAKVDKVVAKDSKTLVWTLKSPYPDFHFAMAQEFLGLHPGNKVDTEAKAKEYFKAPVSAGPLMVKTFNPTGDLFEAVANPNYWAKPILKLLKVVTIPDANARLAAFQNGSVDFVYELPLTSKDIKWDKTKFRIAAALDSGTFMIPTNMGPLQPNKALKDNRVRKALSLSIDRAGIMRTAFGGLSKPNCGMQYNYNNPLYLCSLPKNGARDLAAARKLMKQAGYSDGFKMKLAVPNRVLWPEVAVILKENWSRIGIDVTIDLQPDATIGQYLNVQKNWEIMWFGNNAATPLLQLNNWFATTGLWAGFVGYSDPEGAKLLDEASSMTNRGQIRDNLAKLEKIAYESSHFIPVGTRFNIIGSNIAANLIQPPIPGQLEFFVATNPALPKD
jgi:peptide/nickel transport system substrate-binding protein